METDQSNESRNISRRRALQLMALGGVTWMGTGILLEGCGERKKTEKDNSSSTSSDKQTGKMTNRIDPGTGKQVSLLGFGCMRFPVIEKGEPDIDEEQSQAMIDYAYHHGVNYYDTAWPYHQERSEGFIGQALKKYPRNSFFLADKMPTWLVKDLVSAKDIFETQLKRCGVTCFDYYLLHALSSQEDYDRVYKEYGTLDYLNAEKAAGRIKRLGFSFHGDLDFFHYLLNQPQEWDFVQIQLNYYDWEDESQQSGKLYQLLADRNIPVIVMEPIRGGMLAKLNPGVVEMLREENPDASPASWALRFCASLPAVLTVLSGMSEMEHVKDNVKTFTDFTPLTEHERAVLDKALVAFKDNKSIGCTECSYCMPCPYGVDIPGIFKVYNDCVSELNIANPERTDDEEYKKKRRVFLNNYRNRIADSGQAHRCIGCEKCVSLCPQQIEIPQEMRKIESLVSLLKHKY